MLLLGIPPQCLNFIFGYLICLSKINVTFWNFSMRFALVICLSCMMATLSGQNLSAIEKFRSELTTASEEKTYGLLNSIGFEYRYSYPDSTIYYCNKAYALGVKLKLTK